MLLVLALNMVWLSHRKKISKKDWCLRPLSFDYFFVLIVAVLMLVFVFVRSIGFGFLSEPK